LRKNRVQQLRSHKFAQGEGNMSVLGQRRRSKIDELKDRQFTSNGARYCLATGKSIRNFSNITRLSMGIIE